MTICETPRTRLRELTESDADFVLELLNTPKFLKYIGDRGVRTRKDAAAFINDRYRRSYEENGYGLYAVERLGDGAFIGMCGFVRRPELIAPDLGFAFLPNYERQGYGFEAATAMMKYGRDELGFDEVLAITSVDNDASVKLLEKLGFEFDTIITSATGEQLKLFRSRKKGGPNGPPFS